MSSKTDIFDEISGADAGDIFDEVYQEPVSKTRSVISAPVKGAIKGAEELSKLHDPLIHAISQLFPHDKESVLSKLTEKVLPTRDETAENVLENIGRVAPTAALGGGGVLSSIIQAISGGVAGHVAKEEGLGETGQGISEAVGMGLPGLVKGLSKGITSVFKSPVEKLTSGLTKPRAIGAKYAEKAVISPVRQQKTIENLNREATKLAETTLKKEVPLSEQIKNGIDFESQFQDRFGALQKVAEKANPDIDISPVSKMMSDTASKYRGIPKLHPEAAKIKAEIKAFGNHAPTDLKSALRTYRSNNKKIKGIYETSRLTGKQEEYVDFLVDYNKNLAKSFENTLPKDSAWVKEFKDTNQFYKNYRDAQKAMHLIDPSLGQKTTPTSIQRFADNPNLQKKLELAMGKKGADEIVQIARDVRLASESLNNIPAKELKLLDKILPLTIFIPGTNIPSGATAAIKGFDWLRRGYGWLLSTPARRTSYGKALKAITEGNQSLYLKAAEELQKSMENESED